MNKVSGIARSRAGRLGLVAGIAVATVAGLALPAGANTGHVFATQTCHDGWSVQVTLDNNVTSDHYVEISTTIPGTTGMVDGHYNTTGNHSTQLIWDASGPAPQSGKVTLTILNPNKTVDSSASATLPSVESCGTTTTTWATTTTICPTTTTWQPTTTTWETTTTMPPTTTTMKPTTTTMATTTTAATTTTTMAPTTTVYVAPTTIATTTTQVEATTVSVPPTTVHHVTTTTAKEVVQGTTIPTTTTTMPAVVAQQLPFTGSSTAFPVIFGMSCLTAGGLLLLRKRSSLTRS